MISLPPPENKYPPDTSEKGTEELTEWAPYFCHGTIHFLVRYGRGNDLKSPRTLNRKPDALRYPLPVWKQDMPDWNEDEYDPDKVDQRSEYETRVIASGPKICGA